MKRFVLLALIAFSLVQCNVLEEDTFPESSDPPTPTDPVRINAANMVLTLSNGTGLINIPALLSSEVKAGEVTFEKSATFGSISVVNDEYLGYTPLETKGDYEEDIILKNPVNPQENIPLTIVVRTDLSEFCTVHEFEPAYLGMPLSYSIKKGESFQTDLLDLFCDYQRGGSAGVKVIDHPELNGDDFRITDQNFRLSQKTQMQNKSHFL